MAPMLLARWALPHLIESRGTVINVGSAITAVPNPIFGVYGATKAGLAWWNDALRRELIRRGVRVCLVEPGPVDDRVLRRPPGHGPRGARAGSSSRPPSDPDRRPSRTPPGGSPACSTAPPTALGPPAGGLAVPADRPACSGSGPALGDLADRADARTAPAGAEPAEGSAGPGPTAVRPGVAAEARSAGPERSRLDEATMVYAATRELLGMIKFSHTLFALPFALLGAALAAKGPDGWRGRWQDWLGILLCMATARSAAMAFNRLADRRIDALNPRTAGRHLPSGPALDGARWRPSRSASGAGVRRRRPCCSCPTAGRLILSGPVLLWLLGYSFAKRFTSLAHFWLGFALAMAPMAAWIALRGDLAWPPALLGLAVLLWVAGFDIIYACQDADFDRGPGAAQRPRPAGRPGGSAAGGGLPRGDGRGAGRARAGLSDGGGLLRRGRRGGRAAGLRALRSSGPTT